MHIVPGSFTVVLIGDWNKQFIQPDWVANSIYEDSEVEIGVEGIGTDFSISYRKNNVAIKPSQSKIVIALTELNNESIAFFSKCVINYLSKAYTPVLTAFGINVEYTDEENTRLASIFDEMADLDSIIKMGYEIASTKVSRTLSKDGIIMNIESTINNSTTHIRFNEHHGTPTSDTKSLGKELTLDKLNSFLIETKAIVCGLGYRVDEKGELA